MPNLGGAWASSLTPGRRDLSNILSIIIPKFTVKELYYIGLDVHKDTVAIVINKINFTRRGDLSQHLWFVNWHLRMALNAIKNPTGVAKTAKAEHGINIASLTATQSPRPWTSAISSVAIRDNNRSLRCSLPLNQSYLWGSVNCSDPRSSFT
jgi:hypothetical protein